ncbi:MAG TPA: SpoIIE family protein phosphatase [Terracidiphilus sp.]|jgi:sigma-B regulation protein RsbU (phosphoserine phosphatase)|nr:SpoIIE family protein phosphatase [Terracidiphilus sp.]
MAIGESVYVNTVREQLLAGRARLSEVVGENESERVLRLLEEVDSALHRIDHGTFGVCEACLGTVEEERLRENPLARVCLDCLTPKQQRALEYDLELAAQIQKGLLPPCDVAIAGWDVCYHYQPAGVVSGDYCDLIEGSDGDLHFVLADVSGKGVAAAMLSSNLRAVFRSLLPSSLDATELIGRANRLFRQSALPTQYATLVYGKAKKDGTLEIVNAGHLPVLLSGPSGTRIFESTSQPLGVFGDQQFTPAQARMHSGDTLVLYTDGISEAENEGGDEYGIERLRTFIEQAGTSCPTELVNACKQHLDQFRGPRERFDDETLLAIQYSPAAFYDHSHVAVV